MNLRRGFHAITAGWRMVDDWKALTARIDRVARWMEGNGPLWPDEQLTIEAMIDCQIATSPSEKRETFRRTYARSASFVT